MNESLPRVTILIAARPDQAQVLAVGAARRLDYPRELLEIIVARGRQPSVQRNTAIRAASGELIYFLDDDSTPRPGDLQKAAIHFRDSQVQMVGGPNLCPDDAPLLEQVFAVVLASWIAFGPSRARYVPVGAVRETSEKELILCNLIARRETMLALGGFNEALYPNEENALMDEIQKRGARLLYDPNLIVYRRPRRTLKSFARMLMTYGRGRAEQFRVNPTFGSALNFVPPLFCLYLALLPLLLLGAPWKPDSSPVPFVTLPLLASAAALIGQTLVSALSRGVLRSCLALPLVFLSHVLYGLGFWRGLFTRLQTTRPPGSVEVRLETVPVN